MSTLMGNHIRYLRTLMQSYKESLRPDEPVLSENWKLGHSLNMPLYPTCRCMTSICARNCYAVKPSSPLAFRKHLKKLIRGFNFIEAHPYPEGVAEIIAHECDRLDLKFLRVCGCGDLTPKLVAVVNSLLTLRPDLAVWVSSRLPELAAGLSRSADNLFLMCSFDSSREGLRCWARMKAEGHPRCYPSFLMVNPDDDPRDARIIFPVRGIVGLPFFEGVTCPADTDTRAGTMENACSGCKRCFSPVALDGSHVDRHLLLPAAPVAAHPPNEPLIETARAVAVADAVVDAADIGTEDDIGEALALVQQLDRIVSGARPHSLQPVGDALCVVRQRLAERLGLNKENEEE